MNHSSPHIASPHIASPHIASLQIAPIACHLSDLISFTNRPADTETIVDIEQPFHLRVTVEFNGSGAIALLPLRPWIQVTFLAQPLGTDPTIDLGTAKQEGIPGQSHYTPTLTIANPQVAGLMAEKLYRISAVLRIGAIDAPALITGLLEGLMLQVYSLSA